MAQIHAVADGATSENHAAEAVDIGSEEVAAVFTTEMVNTKDVKDFAQREPAPG